MIRTGGKTEKKIRKIKTKFFIPDLAIHEQISLPLTNQYLSGKVKKEIYIGPYEKHEISILKRTLSHEDKVMEIGSGIGYVSTWCAKTLGLRRVVTYEANPNLIEIIKDTHRINAVDVELLNCILGKGHGTQSFYMENNFVSSSTIQRTSDAIKVQVRTCDLNAEVRRIKPTFLICDIEGGEYHIFESIQFETIRKICLEIHPHVIGNKKTTEVFRNIVHEGFICDFSLTSKNVYFFER